MSSEKELALAVVLAVMGGLAGCNTVEGVGRDIEGAGKAVENASDEAEDEIDDEDDD